LKAAAAGLFSPMAALTINKMPEDMLVALESRAAANGRTVEDEAVACLRDGLSRKPRGVVIENDSLWDSKHSV
jgi:plasmid stability protein